MVCTDPPYNLEIAGNVSGLGKHVHREFVEASGEMTSEEFEAFLTAVIIAMTSVCVDGAIVMTAMDWRHMKEMIAAGAAANLTLNNLCVWVKSNGGMGSLYRSQQELFFIWRLGTAPFVNNVNLGADGRYRTNVWSVPGQNAFGANRDEELALHPTIKPVVLVAEAIRDVSNHGDIVLDPFCGSGTVLIAAEKTDRRAYAMELDPAYVDVAIRRYLSFRPDAQVTLATTGETFEQVAARRASSGDFDVEPVVADSEWDIV
jgi:DNA modification methylase